MATRASQRPRQTKAEGGPPAHGGGPTSWWQWVLIYPTLALSLFSAAPQWIDKFKAPPGATSASEADKQNRLWQKNAACAALPFKGFLNPSNVAVDATICNSGDILVQAVTPENRQVYKWFALEDVLPRPSDGGVIPAANAATLRSQPLPAIMTLQRPKMSLAQFQVTVLCQSMDGRYLKRRISTPQGCFDEVIDTYTGSVVSRNPAPCQC